MTYSRFHDKILPPNTKRRLLAKIFSDIVLHPRKLLWNLNKRNFSKFIYYFRTTDPTVLEEKVRRKISETSILTSDLKGKTKSIKNIKLEEVEFLEFPRFQQPLVSVIIPVWNKWQYTYNCLCSLLKYTDKVSYEIIIVNNASNDETPQMLAKVRNIWVIKNEANFGFTEACNIGAKASTGEFLLFLNNDTEVRKGWLSAMVDLAKIDKSIGLIGGKLVYPDGKLQEAGGIVWNDPENLAFIYGKYDDPNKWEYNFVKEVDYCSGACILVRKDLFKKVGLFDTRFAPAYFEDTDLAFRIRELGYKVMYQPKAEIIHFEGLSAGTDTLQGVKKYQIVNQNKFYDKWRSVLENGHFPSRKEIFSAQDRSKGKKVILFIDHYIPHYDKDAGSFITFEYLKIFIGMGFKVIFWPDNLYQMEPYTSELQQMGIVVIYGSESFKKYIKRYGKYIDIGFIARPHIAIYYTGHIIKYSNAKIVYIAHDLHFLREQRRAKIENNPKLLRAVDDWKTKELFLMKNSCLTLVFSYAEKEIIKKEDPSITIDVSPWVQPLNYAAKNYKERKDIIFIGYFAHMPNEDAALWFANRIFPYVKNEIQGVKFIILGSDPTERILKLKSNDIIVTGYVRDVSGYFQNAKVFVAPLRYGAGFKGKIIQAMSYGLPVVTTTIGAEGMNLNNGENVLIGDTPEEFFKKIVQLYTEERLWVNLSKNSIRFVEENNSIDVAKRKFAEIFDQLLAKKCK